MTMKFLPFDDNDLKKLDRLIALEDYLKQATDKRTRWRMKNKLRDTELKPDFRKKAR